MNFFRRFFPCFLAAAVSAVLIFAFLQPQATPPALPTGGEKAEQSVNSPQQTIIRELETARASWIRRYAMIGFSPDKTLSAAESTLRFRNAPHFLARLETLLQGDEPPSAKQVRAFNMLEGSPGRDILKLARTLMVMDAETNSFDMWDHQASKSWETAVLMFRRNEDAIREADDWLDAFPRLLDMYLDEELLHQLRQVNKHPGMLHAVGMAVEDFPGELAQALETAMEDPEGFPETWRIRKQKDSYLKELMENEGIRLSTEEDRAILWSLRENEASTMTMVELYREFGSISASEVLAEMNKGPEALAVWRERMRERKKLASTFVSRMQLCSNDTVTLPLEQIASLKNTHWGASGSWPLHFIPNAETRAMLEAGQGSLPNGISVSIVPFADIWDQFQDAGEVYALTPDLSGDSVFSFYGRVERKVLPQMNILSFHPAPENLRRLSIVLFSDRPREDVAAHVDYLSLLIAPAQTPQADMLTEDLSYRQLPTTPVSIPADASPKIRLTNFAGGALFAALAEGLKSEEMARLFGPLNTVCVPRWTSPTEAGEHAEEWLCLRRTNPADFVGHVGQDPLLALSEEAITALNRSRDAIPPRHPNQETLAPIQTLWRLQALKPDLSDPAAIRAAFAEGVELCARADIREPEIREHMALLWSLLKLSGREAACTGMKEHLLTERTPLAIRLHGLLGSLSAADPTLWPSKG